MSTTKRGLLPVLATGLAVCVLVTLGSRDVARAQVIGSDRAAGMIVYPNIWAIGPTDTVVEIANTNKSDPVTVHCFYTNAVGSCSGVPVPIPCFDDSDCGAAGFCARACNITDFTMTLTREQPIGWRASEGLSFLPCDPQAVPFGGQEECFNGQQNGNTSGLSSSIPPVDSPLFVGELKCVQIDAVSGAPVAANDLIGRATVIGEFGVGPDAAAYNAIGIQAVTGDANDGDQTLCLGSNSSGECTTAEYAGCPGTLLLNHFFDGAVVEGSQVQTLLTVVPCTEFEEPRLGNIAPDAVTTTVQFLVFNEFEQRFSASTRVWCYGFTSLADIDTRSTSADDGTSVFSVGVQGTLSGQTRIRGVAGSETDAGHGILATAMVSRGDPIVGGRLAAGNVQFSGGRSQADIVRLSAP